MMSAAVAARPQPRRRARRSSPTSTPSSREQGKALARPGARVEATARLRFADGEEAALELRDGRYWVTAAGRAAGRRADARGGARAAAPRARAAQLRGPDARPLAGHARRHRERRAKLVDGLNEPATLPVQVNGDAAHGPVPGGHQVKLRREGGVWRVEDFD